MVLDKNNNFVIFIGLLLAMVAGAIAAASIKFAILIPIAAVAALLFFLFVSDKLKLYHYILVLVPSILLSPPISLGFGPAIRLDDLWIVLGISVLITKIALKQMRFKIHFTKPVKFYAAFVFLIVISILISSFREPYFYANSDWFEVVKNVKLLAIFILALNLRLEEKELKIFINAIVTSLFIASVFGISQYLNLFNVNAWLSPYFTYETQTHSLLVNDRIISTFGNPNVFAGMLLLGIAISLTRYLNEFKFRHMLPLIIFYVSLFLTQSRTTLIAVVVLTVMIIFLSLLWNKKKFKTATYTVLFSIVPLISLNFAPEKFFYRISFLQDLSTDNSFQARTMVWRSVFEDRLRDNMIFGTGPVKKLHYYFDNEWLMIITTYGIVGLALFLLVFTSIFMSLRITKRHSNKKIAQYGIALQALLISYAVYMSTLAVFQQLQMMPIIILVLGVVLSFNNKTEDSFKKTKEHTVR